MTANHIFDSLVSQWGDRKPPLAYPIDIGYLLILLSAGALRIGFNEQAGTHFQHTVRYKDRLFTAITREEVPIENTTN